MLIVVDDMPVELDNDELSVINIAKIVPFSKSAWIKENTMALRCAECGGSDYDSLYSTKGVIRIWCRYESCLMYEAIADPLLIKAFPRWRWKNV